MLKGLVRAVFLLGLEVDDMQGSGLFGVSAMVGDGATGAYKVAAKALLSVVIPLT